MPITIGTQVQNKYAPVPCSQKKNRKYDPLWVRIKSLFGHFNPSEKTLNEKANQEKELLFILLK